MLRKPTHIVVALDQMALFGSARLNHIGVERALCEVLSAIDGRCDLIKDLNKLFTNRLTLQLRIRNALEAVEEAFFLIRVHKVDVQMLAEVTLDLCAFIHPEETGVHKDTGELCPDRLVDQRGYDDRVNATGKSTDDLLVANLLPDGSNGFVDKGAHGPQTLGTADVVEEVSEDIRTPRRVRHFDVNLRRVDTSRMVSHASNRGDGGLRSDIKARRSDFNRVRVRHPADQILVQAGEEVFSTKDVNVGFAVFSICCRND